MKNLLFKYVLLNKRNVIYGILAAVFFAAISIDGHRYYPVALMMCPSLLFSFVVGKMCYMEDSTSTRQFLLSLPVSRADTIFEKNIMSYICIVAGILIANTGGWIIAIMKNRAFYSDLPLMLAICIFLIIYNTVYIFLNYRYDYSKTQFTPYILLGLMLVLFKFGDELMDFFDNNLFIIWLGALCVAIGLNWYILLKLGSDNRGMFDA